MALISDETLLRLGFHISSTGYLKDGALCFTEVSEYDNTGFDCKVVEDEDGEEDSKEAVTDSEKEASKKRSRHKAKNDAAQARVLLLADVPGLSAPPSAPVPVPGLSATVLGLSTPAFESVTMPGLSTPTSASVPLLGLSAAVPELSALASEFVTVSG